VSALATAFLADLSAADLDRLAELLAPRIAHRLSNQGSDDAWLRGADEIAAYIGAPRSRVYALTSSKRIPVERDGSALIARKSELDGWLRSGGAKRP
jgi:excisionase family DNA binding protein